MKHKFYCQNCHVEFESEGRKVEFRDSAYILGQKMMAFCPSCNTECEMQDVGNPSKKNTDFDDFFEEMLRQTGGGCGRGGCSC